MEGNLNLNESFDKPTWVANDGTKLWLDEYMRLVRSNGKHVIERPDGTQEWWQSDAGADITRDNRRIMIEFIPGPWRGRNQWGYVFDPPLPTLKGGFTSEIAAELLMFTIRHSARHRVGGPALVRGDHQEWWQNGRLHRVGSPAITDPAFQEWRQRGELHREDGPAVINFTDTSSRKQAYYLFGNEVSPNVVMHPETLDRAQMINLMSRENRMINYFLHRLGEQFLKAMKARRADAFGSFKEIGEKFGLKGDSIGKLWRIRIPPSVGQGLFLQVVEVVNGTPEPDGTYRHYFLRVPVFDRERRIDIRTAVDAVAWTYGLTAEQYKQLVIRT